MNKDTLGYDIAEEEMEDDPDLKLYITEVGLFDMADDPRTAFETYTVYTAAESIDEATNKAVTLCEERIPVTSYISFSEMGRATEA